MKIAIICTLYPPYVLGGAEVSVALQAKGLAKRGYEVSVITTAERDETVVQDGVTIYRISNRNIYWRFPQRDKNIIRKSLWHFIDIYNVLFKEKIKKLLLQLAPDIVNTSNICGISVVAWDIAYRLQIPVVHTLRDYYLLCPQQTMFRRGKNCEKQCTICKMYSIAKKWRSSHVDAVVGISNFILNKHLSFGYFDKASYREVIYNSVNVRADRRVRQKRNTIGFMGRLSPEKGVELLCEAFLRSHHGSNKLMIAGEGNKDYVDHLRRLFEDRDIVFVGKQNNSTFLSSIDLLIIPSLWHEPFGRVVIESYAAHCPVIVSERGGMTELIKEGLGYSFDPSHIESLISLLNRFYDENLEFNDALFEAEAVKYSDEKTVDGYIQLYNKLVNR